MVIPRVYIISFLYSLIFLIKTNIFLIFLIINAILSAKDVIYLKYTAFDIDFHFHHDKNVKHIGTHEYAKHYHNLFEIYYITSGNCTYFVNNKTYSLKPGDIVLIPEGVIHNTRYSNLPHSRMLINCSPDFVPQSAKDKLEDAPCLFRNSYIADEIKYIFAKIENEYSTRKNPEALRCYTHLLFYTITDNENKYIPTKSGIEYMEKALEYINTNFCSNISLDSISQICSVSNEHFSRTFKKETGFTFCAYVNLLRLKKAESMLRQYPDMTIAEASAKCGFNDSNYFSLKFRKLYGISPKKLQLQNAKS